MSAEEIDQLSVEICEKLLSAFDLKGKNTSIFLPIERFNEVNTWKFIEQLADETFILPVIKGEDLVHIIYESKDQLEISDWGIPEPTYGEEVDPKSIDIILVPLLICDKKGNRVGYGKGFYDRFLQSCRNDVVSIGINFFDPIEEISDVHEGDIPLNFLVSPNAIHSFE